MNLSVQEAAAYLKISEKTLLRWIEQGVIAFKKNLDSYTFDKTVLENWAHSKKLGTYTQQIRIDANQEELEFSLSDAIQRGGVFYNIEGQSLEKIYQNIVEYFPLETEELRETLLEQLIQRESMAPTAIGHGLSIPHPRHPMDWGLGGTAIGIFFLEEPIHKGAHDDEDTYVLFVLLSANIKSHLKTLSKLSHFLHLEDNRKIIETNPSKEELLKILVDW